MSRASIAVATALCASALVGYLARGPSERSRLSPTEIRQLSAQLQSAIPRPVLALPQSLPLPVQSSPAPRDGWHEEQTEDAAQAAPIATAVEVEQSEALQLASELVDLAHDEHGLWRNEDGAALMELWPALSSDARDELGRGLMAAINSGELDIELGARLP